MENEILNKLQNFPRFRERKDRDTYIAILVARRLKLVTGEVKPSDMVSIPFTEYKNFLKLARTYDRYWRGCLKNDESLRGSDYSEGEEMEENVLENLGYKPLSSLQADIELKNI